MALALLGCAPPQDADIAVTAAAVAAPTEQCILPATIAAPRLQTPDPDEIVRGVPATYQMLAMTWSPEWCRTRSDRRSERLQCVDNSFGWVLHGLWPSAQSAPHPRFCKPATRLTAAQVRQNLCLTPSADLLQHEWAAHGACAWDDPAAYLQAAASVWGRLERPDPAALATGPAPVTAGDIRTAFVAANPTLPRQAVAIGLTDDKRLLEVRICYNLGLDRPQPCPSGSRGAGDKIKITVTPRQPPKR